MYSSEYYGQMSSAKVGDKVVYSRRYSDQLTITTVTKVGKQKVSCENGTEWNSRNGRQWGSTKSWGATYANVIRDEEKFEAAQASRRAAKEAEEKMNIIRVRMASQPALGFLRKDELQVLVDLLDEIEKRKALFWMLGYFASWARGW